MTATKDDQSVPNPSPYLEVGCKRCHTPTPKAITTAYDGLCGKCAREAGLA